MGLINILKHKKKNKKETIKPKDSKKVKSPTAKKVKSPTHKKFKPNKKIIKPKKIKKKTVKKSFKKSTSKIIKKTKTDNKNSKESFKNRILNIFKRERKEIKKNKNREKALPEIKDVKKDQKNKQNIKDIITKEKVIDKKISKEFGKKELLKIKKNEKKEIKKNKNREKALPEIKDVKKDQKNTKKSNLKKQKIRLIAKKGKTEESQFLKTFVPGFDKLVNPGIPKGSSVLVEGGPGSGKTLFCLTLLREQCKKGKKVLYMSFEEPEDRLRAYITEFGLNVKEYERKGLLYIKRFNALDIARSVEALLSEAKKELLIDVQPVLIPPDFKPDIVLVDSLTSISSAFSGESNRFRIYMEQLFRYLERNNITSFLIREVANPTHVGGTFVEQGEAVSFLSDGIIVIYSVLHKKSIRKRAIEFIKMRGVDIDRRVVEFNITGRGVVINPNKVIQGDYQLT